VTGILYLSSKDVSACLPSPDEQLALVERTMMSMRNGSFELPPKPAVHPRSDTFIHAMPTYLADADIAALKWIGGSSRNKKRGLPYLSGLIILNDPNTAAPVAILDAAEITAARTAALTALCIRRLAPGASKIAIVGLGVQGRAHEKALKSIEPEAEITAVDATYAPDSTELRSAIEQANVVITAIRMERPARPFIKAEWLVDCQLIVPVDFDAAIEAAAVSNADRFLVDHVPTYEYYRTLDYFRGWPHARLTLADALAAPDGTRRTVCCNLGAATLDATFANAVIERATAEGAGLTLPWP
jgi:alanine dehydrogenase